MAWRQFMHESVGATWATTWGGNVGGNGNPRVTCPDPQVRRLELHDSSAGIPPPPWGGGARWGPYTNGPIFRPPAFPPQNPLRDPRKRGPAPAPRAPRIPPATGPPPAWGSGGAGEWCRVGERL